MNKFFEIWQKLYGSKVGKTTRDFLLGKDSDLSDEAYKEKRGYNKPIGGTGVIGMLVMPDFSGVENLAKGISGFGGIKYNAGLEALETEKAAKKALKVYESAVKRDNFLKNRFGKVWKDLTPEERYGVTVKFGDRWK